MTHLDSRTNPARAAMLSAFIAAAPAAAQQSAPAPRAEPAAEMRAGATARDSVAPPIRGQVYRLGAHGDYAYTRPGVFDFIRNVPRDEAAAARLTTRRESLPTLGLVAATTAALIAVDQPLYDESRRFARRIHLSDNTDMKTVLTVPVFGVKARLEVPPTIGAGIYFLGDAWSSLVIAGGLLTYGAVAKDNRALRTTSEITESLISLALVTQTLKRVTGRESPENATASGGRWRPFTKLSTYNKHVSHYDAMPSGHLATMMATVTVLAQNYPEHRWIVPVGYSVMGVVSFQMMNTGVHWAGDYPLALAIGGAFGHIAVERGRTRLARPGSSIEVVPRASRMSVLPLVDPHGGVGMQMRYAW